MKDLLVVNDDKDACSTVLDTASSQLLYDTASNAPLELEMAKRHSDFDLIILTELTDIAQNP